MCHPVKGIWDTLRNRQVSFHLRPHAISVRSQGQATSETVCPSFLPKLNVYMDINKWGSENPAICMYFCSWKRISAKASLHPCASLIIWDFPVAPFQPYSHCPLYHKPFCICCTPLLNAFLKLVGFVCSKGLHESYNRRKDLTRLLKDNVIFRSCSL